MLTTNGTTNGTHSASSTDADLDTLYAWMPPQTAPQPCPEALFSLTLKGTIGGHEALLTARGQTAEEFRRNLDAIKGLLDPVPARAPAASQGQLSPQHQGALPRPVSGFCAVHHIQMAWNEGREGRKGWFSHRTAEGQWCKGK